MTGINYALILAVLFSICLVCLAAAAAAVYVYRVLKARGDPWTTEELFTGSRPSLALDPITEAPRNCFFTGNYLAYATLDGRWSSEVVDEGEGVGVFMAGDRSSLALDPATGHPRISYRCYTPTEGYHLRYAEWDGTNWSIETVDHDGADGSTGGYNSLKLDPVANDPRIAYVEFANGEVKYAARLDGEWVIETVGSCSGSPGAAVAFSSTGEPRISYRNACHLVLASYIGGSWTTEDVTTEVDSGYESSLSLTSDDRPVIASYKSAIIPVPGARVLECASRDATGWSIDLPVSEEITIGLSLALENSTGYPCISFYTRAEDELRYVSWDGSHWVEEVVDNTDADDAAFLTPKSSLVLSGISGAPRIAYTATDQPRNRIRYAWRD